MVKRKTMSKQKPETVVSIESSFAESLAPMLAQMRQEAMAAAMAAVREELKGTKSTAGPPAPVSRAPQILREAPEPEPADDTVGRPWKPGPGSRYVEPGTRVSKRGRLDSKPAKSKVWSGFFEPAIIEAFRDKCKYHGITQRFGAEQAFIDWIKKPGVGGREREVSWKPPTE